MNPSSLMDYGVIAVTIFRLAATVVTWFGLVKSWRFAVILAQALAAAATIGFVIAENIRTRPLQYRPL